jgi:hypothetical protein
MTSATGGPGVDVPDSRGRTGLGRAGRDLTRNPDVVVRDVEVRSDGWRVLRCWIADAKTIRLLQWAALSGPFSG